jgi:hypothetical protein
MAQHLLPSYFIPKDKKHKLLQKEQLLYDIKHDILKSADFRDKRISAVIPGMGRLFFPFGLSLFPDMIFYWIAI